MLQAAEKTFKEGCPIFLEKIIGTNSANDNEGV